MEVIVFLLLPHPDLVHNSHTFWVLTPTYIFYHYYWKCFFIINNPSVLHFDITYTYISHLLAVLLLWRKLYFSWYTMYAILWNRYTYTIIHTYMHTYIYTYIYTYMYMYIHTYIHNVCNAMEQVYIYNHTYIHAHVHTCIHTCTCTHMNLTLIDRSFTMMSFSHTGIHTLRHTHTDTHRHTDTQTQTHTHTHMHTYIHTHF